MTKSELIAQLASKANLPKKQAEQIVNLIFDSISDALARKDRVELRGFGSFVAKHYPPYQGRNPRTGEVTHVAEKYSPFFKAGKELRERVDGNK